MRIGEFAASLGLSIDTVRRLERRGLVFGERDWCGHRRYSQDDFTKARQALFARGGTRSGIRQQPRRRPAPLPNDLSVPPRPRRGGQ